MLVSQLDIEEFRGIKRCKEPIVFSKFTVLVGRNCSGKSTVLEALSLLPNPKLTEIITERERYYFIRNLHSGKSLVYGYSGTAKLKYIVDGRDFKITVDDGDAKTDKDYSASKLAEIFKVNQDEIQSISIFIPNCTQFIRQLEKYIEREEVRNRAVKLGANVSVAKAVSECIHEEFTEVIPETLSVRKEKPDGNVLYIKLSDLGDGVEKAIKVMLVLETLKPKLVLWDDFEASAHPSLIKILLKWLIEKDWQVVISTHSIDVLYELVELKDIATIDSEDVAVLLLEKTEDDVLVCEKLNLNGLEDLIIANQDPRIIAKVLQLR
jgi:predicted ATP-dependent endonuclease of OLD family